MKRKTWLLKPVKTITNLYTTATAALSTQLFFIANAVAADYDLPKVSVPGVSSSDDPLKQGTSLMKYGIKIILWGAVIFTSVYILRNIIKEINKVRRSEEGKWSDITGELLGNVMFLLGVIILGTWLNSLL